VVSVLTVDCGGLLATVVRARVLFNRELGARAAVECDASIVVPTWFACWGIALNEQAQPLAVT